MVSNNKLAVDIGGGIKLKNPVMTASGTFGYGLEFKEFIDLNRLAGIQRIYRPEPFRCYCRKGFVFGSFQR